MNEWIVNSVPVLLYGYGGCTPFFPPACFLLATNIGPDFPLLRHPGLFSIEYNLSHTISCKGPKTRLDPLVSEPLLSLQIFPFNLHEFAFSEISCIFLPALPLQTYPIIADPILQGSRQAYPSLFFCGTFYG